MSPPSGYFPHMGRPYSSASWRQAPACLMGLGWETKWWRSLKWGSHWHNQCAWTFETLEFIPIRAGERQYRGARAKGSASYWLQPQKDDLFVSLRIWREKKKSFKLDCFLTVPCTVERRLQRRTHGLTRKINDRRQSQLNACFNQGSPEETRLPLSHNLNVPMEMYSCLLTAKKFQPQASVTL